MTSFWKNKTVLAFIALAHHTRFIVPVMDRLRTMGAQIHFVVGQAERSQDMTALQYQLDYTHVFDHLGPNDTNDIRKNYLLLRKEFSRALSSDFSLGTQPITVIDKTLYATAAEYVGFKNILKKINPDLCFALHELNRWGKLFAFRSKQAGIPFITLQEGLGYGLDFGYMGHVQYSTFGLVWGERIKNKFCGFDAPVDRVIPVGNTHLAHEITLQKQNRTRDVKRKAFHCRDKQVLLLVLSPALPVPDSIRSLFKAVSMSRNHHLFAKFHPATRISTLETWKASFAEDQKNNMDFILDKESIYDLLSICDICVLSRPSTTGLEAVAFGKPLVQLMPEPSDIPYSFVNQGIAVAMTPDELARQVDANQPFTGQIPEQAISNYLARELTDTTHTIDRVCSIIQSVVRANKPKPSVPLTTDTPEIRQWSMIIPVSTHPEGLLFQLESISVTARDAGDYEVILIEPEDLPDQILTILDSLKGNLLRIKKGKRQALPAALNRAARKASGKALLFFQPGLGPRPGWLEAISRALEIHGDQAVFGARIADTQGRIIHAGMVVDETNSLVSAYRHLKPDFPALLKERRFQSIDRFLALSRGLFLSMGGFSPETGSKAFPDFCLRLQKQTNANSAVIYLPDAFMIQHGSQEDSSTSLEDSIVFYSRWHGVLWHSEKDLYHRDGISETALASARMASAMASL